nr:PREDICTED: caspase-2-like isoform X1 [Lepisosteus oculatus]
MKSPCGMLPYHREALRRCSVALCKDLVIDELVQHLLSDSILTESMAESIMADKTSFQRNRALLSLLPKRGPQAFESFCTALRETEQQHLESMLRDRAERQRGACGDFPLPLPTQEDTMKAKRARTQETMEYCLDADGPTHMGVLACAEDFYFKHCQQSYKMTSRPRGLALVISNVDFQPVTPDLEPRAGGEVDEETLSRLFTELGFRVTLHRNQTAQEVRASLEQFSQSSELRAVDSSVVCLLSHGVEGAVYGTDGQLVELDWVLEYFDNAHCPQLQNKPKMFFIQACRGEDTDSGVDQSDGPERTSSPGCEQGDAAKEVVKVKLPQRSDMICGFASLKGTAAMRNTRRGSWFIQEMSSVFRQRARDKHLADLLVEVNARIKQREGFAPGTPFHRSLWGVQGAAEQLRPEGGHAPADGGAMEEARRRPQERRHGDGPPRQPGGRQEAPPLLQVPRLPGPGPEVHRHQAGRGLDLPGAARPHDGAGELGHGLRQCQEPAGLQVDVQRAEGERTAAVPGLGHLSYGADHFLISLLSPDRTAGCGLWYSGAEDHTERGGA